ncbi:60S ribosomal protein L17-like [Coccinella septempunctata]|uniref:60S ribosomal protein L17-like n=1 Tax=Coccinella septempunctata TaxID=41139 RepID=UPI001D067A84|nr:60S ribosomal protein L17-like [Coccinella septempunctata]
MGKKSKGNNYSTKAQDLQNLDYAKAKASNVAVHFKNTVETANAIRRMTVPRALTYLKNVLAHKECVPFRKFKSGIGRKAQAKQFGVVNGRWPEKSAKIVMEVVKNAISNTEYNNKDYEQCVIQHIQVNQAPKTTRRTYRAHGRINPYIRHLCHIQVVIGTKKSVCIF